MRQQLRPHQKRSASARLWPRLYRQSLKSTADKRHHGKSSSLRLRLGPCRLGLCLYACGADLASSKRMINVKMVQMYRRLLRCDPSKCALDLTGARFVVIVEKVRMHQKFISRPIHLRGVAAGRGEVDMEILHAGIGELPFDCLFQPHAFDQLPARHHSVAVETACSQRAPAQLVRNCVDGVECLLALAYVNRKTHPVRRGDAMMLVVDQDDFLTWRRIGQANAARVGSVGDFAHRTVRGKLGIGEREKVRELGGFETANAEVHGCSPWCCGDNGDCAGGLAPASGTRFLTINRTVMAGLLPAIPIHGASFAGLSGMPGSRPGMTAILSELQIVRYPPSAITIEPVT